jgi:phosphoribosylglycinamide formyltransferase 1
MWGEHVHRAVLAAGDRESGCTAHLCNERYDEGRILVQARVPVLVGDSPATLAARVFAAECEAYPAAIALRWREITSGERC